MGNHYKVIFYEPVKVNKLVERISYVGDQSLKEYVPKIDLCMTMMHVYILMTHLYFKFITF